MTAAPRTGPTGRTALRPLRRIGAVIPALLSGVLGVAAGGVVILAVAAIVPQPVVFLGAGAVTVLVVTAVVARVAVAVDLRRARRGSRGWRAAWIAGAAWTALVAVGFGLLFLRPFPPMQQVPVPADVQFWQLADGSRLAYRASPSTAADRKATPVIFLHGGPGTPGEGLPYGTQALNAAGYDVYSYDQIGAGRSTRLDDVTGYTVSRNVEDLETIRKLIGAEHMILIGQSWGGSLAAQYLAAHPNRVAKVAFTSPGEIWPGARPGSGASPWGGLTGANKKRYDELTSDSRFLLQAVLLTNSPQAAHRLVGDAESDSRLHEIAVAGRDLGRCPGAPRGEGEVHQNPQGFYTNQLTNADFAVIADPRPVLRTVRTPALILRAECDYVRWTETREYRDTLPDATLVYIPGAGHSITADAGPAYLRSILGFLAGEPLVSYTGADDPAG
ncbi:alpha/beta hydrolase [Tsukamurella asaccharolytica]|uniref:Alpha/beta hydrolase n=1 Tax=Tsukamurella asaccharolytica TaxID=2592067 RepID=A0A5C5RFI4_9ACTN|nr:alpha/beta hydrolase [Tsukamurella asaccharolytica]TWS20881.1 alpha/beta hydrolase [Tsukamurella asaccharolytica]